MPVTFIGYGDDNFVEIRSAGDAHDHKADIIAAKDTELVGKPEEKEETKSNLGTSKSEDSLQAKVSNRYFENQESKVANESFHRRWSINKQKYVVTQSDDRDKHRKGLYYLIEKRKKKY